MKILLVGEYNRSHKFLKDGLIKLGHEVTVIGLNDGFKKVDVDIEIKRNYTSGFSKKFKVLLSKLFNIDLHSISVKKQIQKHEDLLSGFDVVQFVNESSFLCNPKTEKSIFDLLKQWNKDLFLLSCGTDYLSVKYAHDKKFRYSILTPYFENKGSKAGFSPALKYLSNSYKDLHSYIFKNIKGVIASDLDYHIPLLENDKYLGMVPNPVNTEQLKFKELKTEDRIVIFHGINLNNYHKKGNDIFDETLEIIQEKHADKIEIITVKNLPYKDYIKAFDKAHILLDQIYAYDQGFNALEAMAKGKVVFTGAEKEWLDYYNLEKNTVAINALPDAKKNC